MNRTIGCQMGLGYILYFFERNDSSSLLNKLGEFNLFKCNDKKFQTSGS